MNKIRIVELDDGNYALQKHINLKYKKEFR